MRIFTLVMIYVCTLAAMINIGTFLFIKPDLLSLAIGIFNILAVTLMFKAYKGMPR